MRTADCLAYILYVWHYFFFDDRLVRILKVVLGKKLIVYSSRRSDVILSQAEIHLLQSEVKQA